MKRGDLVEVVTEEELRAGMQEFEFCSVGKRGTVLGENPNSGSTNVLVYFGADDYSEVSLSSDPLVVGCEVTHLRKH